MVLGQAIATWACVQLFILQRREVPFLLLRSLRIALPSLTGANCIDDGAHIKARGGGL